MVEDRARALLDSAAYGHLATVGEDGCPYTIGMSYLLFDGSIYFHCGTKGQKLDNLRRNDRVCFTVDRLIEIKNIGVETPCKVGVSYESVVCKGRASTVADEAKKRAMLVELAKKYAPDIADRPMPEQALEKTLVVQIAIESLSYKQR